MTQGDAKWDAMTDEEFAVDVARRAGRAARVALDPPEQRRRKQVPARVGEKPKPRRGIPYNAIKPQGVSWREDHNGVLHWHDEYKGKRNRSGLPNSGAPWPPEGSK